MNKQEQEIASLRLQHVTAYRRYKKVMDFMICLTLVVSWKNVHGKLSSAQYLGSIIIIGQIINLIFNLSPDIVPQFQLVRTKYVQALLLATAVLTLCGCTPLVRGEGTWRIAETATLFAPLLVSFASCLMKRSEVDMENQLKELEGKRYKMKGA